MHVQALPSHLVLLLHHEHARARTEGDTSLPTLTLQVDPQSGTQLVSDDALSLYVEFNIAYRLLITDTAYLPASEAKVCGPCAHKILWCGAGYAAAMWQSEDMVHSMYTAEAACVPSPLVHISTCHLLWRLLWMQRHAYTCL